MKLIKTSSVYLLTAISFLVFSCASEKIETKDNFEVIELPDQSVVYLNHNSSVSFDKDFKERNIKLEGEAFFMVTKTPVPFVIETSEGEITVLGTEFNVNDKKEELEVEVETGTVEVKASNVSQKVKRGQKVVFNKGEKTFHRSKANFKFRVWINELRVEFKKMGKELKSESKKAGKEFRRIGKEIKKGF